VNFDAEMDLADDGYRVVRGIGDKCWIAEKRIDRQWRPYGTDHTVGAIGQRELLFTHKKQALSFIVKQRNKDREALIQRYQAN
jgi:hypothetical protein